MLDTFRTRRELSMIHSASPQSRPAGKEDMGFLVNFEKWGQTDGRTTCVNIVITTNRNYSQPVIKILDLNFFFRKWR